MAHSPPTAATNRTRSQTTLHSFFTTRVDLAASPLKQARNALKLTPPADPHHPSPPPLLPQLDPASPDNLLKRPSSPAKDAALLVERDSKRLRHQALFPKPSLPVPSLPASPDRRAKSVPPRPLSPPSHSPVPLLDLNNVPSSPRRSPTKFRIASLPPQSPGKHLHPHLPHRPSSFPHPPPKSPSPFFLQPLPLISDPNLPPDASTPLPPPPTTPMSPLTPLPQDDSLLTHLIPDLDPTPVHKPIPTLLFSIDPLPGPSTLPPPPDVPSPSATPTRPPPHLPPLVPSSTEQTQPESMLPRPSGVKARMKPKLKLAPDISNKKVKNPRNKKPITLGPPQIRNTRSTRAHREKSVPPEKQAEQLEQIEQAEEDVNDAFTDILSSPRPISRLSNTQSTYTQPSQSRPPSSSSQPTLPRSKLPQPKTPRAPSSQLPQPLQMPHGSRPAQPSSQSSALYLDTTARLRDEPPVTPANGRRRSQSLSYARPTSSSAAKTSPVKPTLPIRSTSRPPSTSTSNSTSSAHTGTSSQVAESGEKNEPAGPFDFKSIRTSTSNVFTAEPTTQASGANGKLNGSRIPFGKRAKTPVGVRAKTAVTGMDPKVKGKERARSVGPGIFARAKTPVSAEALVEVAPPQDLGRLAAVDAGKTVKPYADGVLSRGEGDSTTPRQGRKQDLASPVLVVPPPAADHVQADEVDGSGAVKRAVFAESDHPAVDADGDTAMLPPASDTLIRPSSEDSELSELSELEDSSVAEQASLKGSGQESESDVPDDAAPQPGPSFPRRPPAAGSAPLNCSLSTLSQALERLNAPVPSRPNTSLGFHRSVSSDGNDSFSSEPGTSDDAMGGKRTNPKGKAQARPRPVVPTATTKGKGKAGSTLKTAVNGQISTATGQKKLRQTTLMLPPPLPVAGTRTTRLRSAALAAATTSVPSTPRSSAATTTTAAIAVNGKTPKDRQVTLALAPSLGKIRAGLAANAPGQVSSGSTSIAPSAVPSSSGLSRAGLPAPATGAATRGTTRRAFLSSGSGRGGSGSLAKPPFGVGKLNLASGSGASTRGGFALAALRGRGGGNRVTQRASKVSSLPMVVGSPVKGGAMVDADEDTAGAEVNGTRGDTGLSDDEMVVVDGPQGMEGVQEMSTKDKIDEWLRTADKDILRDLGHGSDEESADAGGAVDKSVGSLSIGDLGPVDPEVSAKEKEERAKEREARRNASRRASMARTLLTQSLSALPSATSPSIARGKDAKGKGRAVSSSYPATVAAQDQLDEGDAEKIDAPTPPPRRAHATRLATGALSTPPNSYKERSLRSTVAGGSGLGDVEHPSGGSADGKGKGKAKTGLDSPAALAVLKDCRIFVDVRTDEGDDAGSLFVDMLRDLGAKISTRVGSRCTHVVFKNGLMSTLKSYRMLSDRKPHVVGIAWVVECAEQCKKVEETRFVVNLDLANVSGVNKRRKSMLPKNFSPMANKIATSPPSSDSYRMDSVLNTSLGAASRSAKGANGSLKVSSPMAFDEDGDTSLPMLTPPNGGGADDEESLPPLEKARRRRGMMSTS